MMRSITTFFLIGLGLCPASALEPRPDKNQLRHVCFSPDGAMIAAAFGYPDLPGKIILWDHSDRSIIWTHSEKNCVLAADFSPDGKLLAIGTYDGAVKLLDAKTGKVLKELPGHKEAARGVAFSPDGKLLASAGFDKLVKLYDVEAARELATLVGHAGKLYKVAFSPDGKHLISSGHDLEAKVWDVAVEKQIAALSADGFIVQAARWTRDGKWILSASNDGNLRVWNGSNWKKIAESDPVHVTEGLDYSPLAARLVVWNGCDQQEFTIYSIGFKQPTEQQLNHIHSLLKQLNADDYDTREAAHEKLLDTGFPGLLVLRKAYEESMSTEVRIRCRRIMGQMLGRDGTTIKAHEGGVTTAHFSPDGKTLATGGNDGKIILWNVRDLRKIAELTIADGGES